MKNTIKLAIILTVLAVTKTATAADYSSYWLGLKTGDIVNVLNTKLMSETALYQNGYMSKYRNGFTQNDIFRKATVVEAPSKNSAGQTEIKLKKSDGVMIRETLYGLPGTTIVKDISENYTFSDNSVICGNHKVINQTEKKWIRNTVVGHYNKVFSHGLVEIQFEDRGILKSGIFFNEECKEAKQLNQLSNYPVGTKVVFHHNEKCSSGIIYHGSYCSHDTSVGEVIEQLSNYSVKVKVPRYFGISEDIYILPLQEIQYLYFK